MEAKAKRKKSIGIFFLFILLTTIIYLLWNYFYASKIVTTDNAYTKVDIAQVLPKISSPVKEVKVIDTQYVQKGDVIIILDDSDAKIAYEKAKANLELTRRKVKQLISNDLEFDKKIDLNEAKIETAKVSVDKALVNYKKAQKDLKRYDHLLKTKSVSKQKYDDIKLIFDEAKISLENSKVDLKSEMTSKTVTKAQQESNMQLILDKNVEDNPEVLEAKANLDKAKLDLQRTIIKAPISGIIAQKEVKVGQFVNTSNRLLNIIPIDKIYVDANFKENKLKKVKIGQKVELYSDIYGKDILYHGKVVGISGATGSALSLIPAQNATGNWIKVVQRLPIRIKINEEDLKKNPLYLGLSMHTKIFLNI